MGAYRLAIYFKWQISIGVGYEYGFIVINLPLTKIMICTKKGAKGNNLKYSKNEY